jgi:hypothetical protein
MPTVTINGFNAAKGVGRRRKEFWVDGSRGEW